MGIANLQSRVLGGVSHAPKEHHEVPYFPFCLAVVGSSGGRSNSASVERFFCYHVDYSDLDGLAV